MDIILSIIVPVYNVENFLDECVQSIIRQAENDIEIILVDDGSTDNSGKMCDAYAETYSLITVVHKVNGGLASARNAGLDKAKGQYIAFVDSDDRIADGSIKAIKGWAKNQSADICFMNAVKFYADGTKQKLEEDISQYSIQTLNKLEVMRILATLSKYPGSACTKIFRKVFLEDNNIRFPDDRRLHEDLYFTIKCIDAALTYDALEIPYYEYRQGRIGSITQGPKDHSIKDLIQFVIEETDIYTKNNFPINKAAEYIMAFIAYEYTLILWKYYNLSNDYKQSTKEFLQDYKWILQYNHTKRICIIKQIMNIIGIDQTSKALNYVVKRKKN